eukprot:497193_1
MNVNINAINQQKRDYLSGYIRRLQKLMPTDAFHIIPVTIINIILLYFYELTINTTQCGRNLGFIHNMDGSAIATKLRDSCCSTFVFGEKISAEHYSKFNLHIKWLTAKHEFIMGFVKCDEPDWKHKINWNDMIGGGYNAAYSVGIYANKFRKEFLWYDKFHKAIELAYKTENRFRQSDEFILSFDFIKDAFVIYHNGKQAQKLYLSGCKLLIPAFTLFMSGEQIKITKYVFVKHKKKLH